MSTADQLRQKHRSLRASIDPEIQASNAQGVFENLCKQPELQAAQRIAAYIAIRGEISLAPTMKYLAEAGKQVYLPILRGEVMHFAPWSPSQPLQKKGFGLLEPEVPESLWCPAEQLDLVLAPLVVFDPCRNRIGQGGGFYDRCFAFKRLGETTQPTLMGVAHDSQREEQLPSEPWDVRLDLIVTERATYTPSP